MVMDSIPCSFMMAKVFTAFSAVVIARSSVKMRLSSMPQTSTRYCFMSPASVCLSGLLGPVAPPEQTRMALGKDRAAAAAAWQRPFSSSVISPSCSS